jgi:Holliday junction resolvase RusA-like endonuclease
MLDFKIIGKIVGKQRPRATTFGGHARVYTPKDTMNYENLVKFSFLEKYPNFIPYDSKTPLKVKITAFKPIPKAYSKKKRQQALDREIRPLVKPDLDNIAKSILDGLNQVVFEDDKSVVDLHVVSYYHQVEMVLVEIDKISVD